MVRILGERIRQLEEKYANEVNNPTELFTLKPVSTAMLEQMEEIERAMEAQYADLDKKATDYEDDWFELSAEKEKIEGMMKYCDQEKEKVEKLKLQNRSEVKTLKDHIELHKRLVGIDDLSKVVHLKIAKKNASSE